MGIISDALEKSKVEVSDRSKDKGHFLNIEAKPDLIRDEKNLENDLKLFLKL